MGALKATFLDAYLGQMLTSGLLGTEEVAGGTGILIAETLAIITVSVLVSQFATQVFAEMMTEEGFDTSAALAAPAQEASTEGAGAAAAAGVLLVDGQLVDQSDDGESLGADSFYEIISPAARARSGSPSQDEEDMDMDMDLRGGGRL